MLPSCSIKSTLGTARHVRTKWVRKKGKTSKSSYRFICDNGFHYTIMSSTFHHPPPPPQTRNHISDLGNNCFATPTNTAKKQRLLRAQKALQTALISQISQLGNEGQVQLEVMGKYPWEKKEFKVRSRFHNMLFVAVLMFETHGCCLPWWDSPILVLTSARRSLTLLV